MRSPPPTPLLLTLHELIYQNRNLIGSGIKGEVSAFDYMDLRAGHVFAIVIRLADFLGCFVLSPDHQKLWLVLLHPCLPLRIVSHVSTVVVKQIARDHHLSRFFQESIHI